ncbi:MAG: GntR family transcriptional regulator [Anaerolineae bacterium]|nr:GntR family transcriptional regulator [Anaerolineae bacterium]
MKGSGRRGRPLYWQVADDVLAKIETGIWSPGDKLPSERELCERYGVSQITVRRALRELGHLERIYSHHGVGWFVAEDDTGEQFGRVAIIMPEFDWLTMELVRRLAVELSVCKVGLQLLVGSGDEREEIESLTMAQAQGAQAIALVASGQERGSLQRYEALLHRISMPALLLLRPVPDLHVPQVIIDERVCIQQITRHVLSLGHRRLAYAGQNPALLEGHECYRGFATALWEHGLELPLDWVFVSSLFAADEASRLSDVLTATPAPTALVCGSDLRAAEAMRVLREAGLSCPDDVAIVGLGDHSFAPLLSAPLTTYRFDLEGLAQAAAAALVALLGGEAAESATFEGELVVRQSCGAGLSTQF